MGERRTPQKQQQLIIKLMVVVDDFFFVLFVCVRLRNAFLLYVCVEACWTWTNHHTIVCWRFSFTDQARLQR